MKVKPQAITRLSIPSLEDKIKITPKNIITKKTSIKLINISALLIST